MKAIKLLLAVIEEIGFAGRQSQEYKYIVKMTKGDKSYKVMIHIDCDSYKFQSSAIAYVWKDGSLEWSRITSIPYNTMKSLSGMGHELRRFKADRDILIGLTEQILF